MNEYVVNFYILRGKYYIHKQTNCIPKWNVFLSDVEALEKSRMQINNKKSVKLLDFMENLFSVIFEYVLRKEKLPMWSPLKHCSTV